MPPAPLYGFSGRARELQQLARWLLRGQAVLIHGFGGVGKTTLAREAADWLTRTGMYRAVCFVSFEHGGDASTLLSALVNRLGVTGDYDPRDDAAALDLLRQHVRSPGFSRNLGNANLPPEGGTTNSQPPPEGGTTNAPTNSVLIVADNLESILPGGDAPLADVARAQLWGVLLALRAAGAGVLLTSRDEQLLDARLAHGRTVKHLPLGGLDAEDAYHLARQLGKDLDIAEARLPYPVLRDLLVQLDHHPLALQLVLRVLESL